MQTGSHGEIIICSFCCTYTFEKDLIVYPLTSIRCGVNKLCGLWMLRSYSHKVPFEMMIQHKKVKVFYQTNFIQSSHDYKLMQFFSFFMLPQCVFLQKEKSSNRSNEMENTHFESVFFPFYFILQSVTNAIVRFMLKLRRRRRQRQNKNKLKHVRCGHTVQTMCIQMN